MFLDTLFFLATYVDFLPSLIVFCVSAIAKNLATSALLYGTEEELNLRIVSFKLIIICIFSFYLVAIQCGVEHMHNYLAQMSEKIEALQKVLNSMGMDILIFDQNQRSLSLVANQNHGFFKLKSDATEESQFHKITWKVNMSYLYNVFFEPVNPNQMKPAEGSGGRPNPIQNDSLN